MGVSFRATTLARSHADSMRLSMTWLVAARAASTPGSSAGPRCGLCALRLDPGVGRRRPGAVGALEATVALEVGPQTPKGVVKPRFHCSEPDVEERRRLLQRHPVQVIEDHDALVLRRQSGDA